jgi:acetyltransferase-like isoleucine patch superfamily enzyme
MINYIFKLVKEQRFGIRIKKLEKYIVKGESYLISPFTLNLRNIEKNKIYLEVGDNTMLSCQITFETQEGKIVIGNNSFIGSSQLICRNKITIEDNVFVAWGCSIYDHNSHSINYKDRQKDIQQQLEDFKKGLNFIENKNWNVVKSSPILIKSNAWIGMNCIILKGVTIGEGAIVGAGSVVTKDVPDWTVVGGNPAKVIRELKNK